MTVHAAKGLEFPYVFLCGMNEGVFPSRRTRDLPGMEEERRLAFVAMTRAEKQLFLSSADGRNFDGTPRYPSRFVLDIDPGLLAYVRPMTDQLIHDTRDYITRLSRFLPEYMEMDILSAGTRIRHGYLGEGTVLDADPGRRTYLIRVDTLPTPRMISFKVSLEVIG